MIRILIIAVWLLVAIFSGYWFVYCVKALVAGAPYWSWEGSLALGLLLIVSIACMFELLFKGKDHRG